jgi:hypothetical protein
MRGHREQERGDRTTDDLLHSHDARQPSVLFVFRGGVSCFRDRRKTAELAELAEISSFCVFCVLGG